VIVLLFIAVYGIVFLLVATVSVSKRMHGDWAQGDIRPNRIFVISGILSVFFSIMILVLANDNRSSDQFVAYILAFVFFVIGLFCILIYVKYRIKVEQGGFTLYPILGRERIVKNDTILTCRAVGSLRMYLLRTKEHTYAILWDCDNISQFIAEIINKHEKSRIV
jgi:hypothetical protein